MELRGPAGERNVYSLEARGAVLCDASTGEAIIAQAACALACGARALLRGAPAAAILAARPEGVASADADSPFEAALTDRAGEDLIAFLSEIAARAGPIVSVFRVDADIAREGGAPLDFLIAERSLCVNTTAAGGNASLMSIG
jgi:RHH-type proline utilization regulon transcriptional repressor/proline dehydrogenase/delta 1-pyrroline-5-carboxylate dehydrogenase